MQWAVGREDVSWRVGIVQVEGDKNLPGDEDIAGGEVVFAADSLSQQDGDFELSCNSTGE